MRVVCFGVLFLFVLLAVPLNAAKKIDPEKFRGTLTTSQGGGVVYYRTHPFNRSHPSVRRVVIVVHGLGRTANGYFCAVYESAQADHRGVGKVSGAASNVRSSSNSAAAFMSHRGTRRSQRRGRAVLNSHPISQLLSSMVSSPVRSRGPSSQPVTSHFGFESSRSFCS